MTNFDHPGPGKQSDPTRVVTCDMSFLVSEPTEVVVQVVASSSAGHVEEERFEVLTDGDRPSSLVEFRAPEGATLHVIRSMPGRLTLSYRAQIRVSTVDLEGRKGRAASRPVSLPRSYYERQVYLRPSRYCPSDHLIGFAVAEFGTGREVVPRVSAIAKWIRQRIEYVPGSGTVHDSAEDTLLTGVGTCRDFAHLGIALCRATGIPARFTAVYAPGLSPMDFHAVFEALADGHWSVYDPTGLAPRTSLVRVVTGRDAADAAFAEVNSGIAELQTIEVTAVAQPSLPVDDHLRLVELA
jgi:transglutaminase-like putative cysteine protease